MRTVKEVAEKMLDSNSKERQEAEKMIGKTFEEMTKQERVIASTILAAFDGKW